VATKPAARFVCPGDRSKDRNARASRGRVSDFGKPDKTGRSSGSLTRSERKLLAPPTGRAWIWVTHDLATSDAWRGMSRYCFRFVAFLMLEYMNHAGRENGRLQATFTQLVAFGISRRKIEPAINEAVQHGLVAVERRGGLYGADQCRTTSLYRLTWIGCVNPAREATNEWKRYKRKIISPVPHGGTESVPPVGNREAQKEAVNG
jgi:hypothetical protein